LRIDSGNVVNRVVLGRRWCLYLRELDIREAVSSPRLSRDMALVLSIADARIDEAVLPDS
jgi:hypothetical protein